MKSKPDFGDWVMYTHVMRRREVPVTEKSKYRHHGYNKEWVPIKLPSPQKGIYLGPRTLQKGYVVYPTGWESPTEWHQTGTTPAALVAVSLRKSAIYVSPDHMEVAPCDLHTG